MRRVLAALAVAVPLLVLAAPAAHASGATCALTGDASGNLAVTGAGLAPSYYYGWGLYAEGVTPPAGYTQWLDYGYFWTAADGSFTFTMNTVAFYEAEYPGLGPYPLAFYVFPLKGGKGLIGDSNLETHSNTLAECTYPAP